MSGVALITGAGSGIGEAIAHRLAAVGYRVAVNDHIVERAERVAAAIGGDAFALGGDVTDEAEVDALVTAATERGPLRVLINNAGIGDSREGTVDKDMDAWQRVFDVNVRGVFLCCRRAGRDLLAEGRGAVVNLASVFATGGVAARSAYGPSKAAVINLTQTLAVEWGGAGVRVNAIAPGWVRTPLLEEIIARNGLDLPAMQARVPAGRLATPQDIAHAAAFLVSDEAAYINGAILPVDGGFTASLAVP